MTDAGRAFHEGGQLVPGTSCGSRFERVAAREHQADDDPGEVLPEHERAHHRNEGNGVNADVPMQERPRHRPAKREKDRDRRGRPDGVTRLWVSGEVEERAACDAHERGKGEELRS